MPQLNLASEVFRSQLIARRKRMLFMLGSVLLVVILAAWGIPALLTRSVESQIAAVGQEVSSLDAQLQARRDDVRPIVLFLRRLDMLKQRLDDHVGWSPILAEFERLMPANARLTALTGSANDGHLSAQVLVPTVDAAADFIASVQHVRGTNETMFSHAEVKSVAISEGSLTPGYIVSLQLPVSPSRFLLSPRNQ